MVVNDDRQTNLLRAIDFEISRIDDNVSKAGWNFWILLGSIATLSWLLLEELGKGTQEWIYSLLVFLMFTLEFEVAANLRVLFYPTIRNQAGNRFFVASTAFGSSRLVYLFVLFRNSILWLIVLFIKHLLFLYQLLLIYYAVFSALALFVLLASFIDAPLRSSNSRRPAIMGGILVVLMNSMVVGFLLNEILSGKLSIGINEYKIGALIFGISFLVSNILTIDQNTYQRTALTNIRRDFLLGNLNIDEAKKQTEILLLGMQADDYLQDEIRLILDLINKINKQTSEIDKDYTELIDAVSAKKIAKMKTDELLNVLDLAINMFDRSSKVFVNNKHSIREVVTQYEKLKRKILLLGKDSQLQGEFLEKISQSIDVSFERVNSLEGRQQELEKRIASISKRVGFTKKNNSSFTWCLGEQRSFPMIKYFHAAFIRKTT